MLDHYFKITFRNMWRYKTQSFTAIFGLAFSLACFVPAICWMHYETSYDRYYPDSEYIYRVYSVENNSGKVNVQVPGVLGRELNEQFPAIKASTGFVAQHLDYSTDVIPYIQLNTMCVDSTFFQIFPQQGIDGDL